MLDVRLGSKHAFGIHNLIILEIGFYFMLQRKIDKRVC